MLAVVILLVAASHIEPVRDHLGLVPWVVLTGILFLASGLVISKLMAAIMQLPAEHRRQSSFH